MSFELFEKEQNIIAEAKELLSNGGINDPKSRDAFAELLKNYEKLSKSTKRLVRVSDRNEAELNKVAKSLDEKNAMLEGLSSKLSKYLSPQIYESIFSGEQAVQLRTERKKLTIFFSDIKDFTATTDDLEPEDITFLVNDYLTEMSEIALKHGATIDKFIGDAVMVIFGAPKSMSTQEQRERSVSCGLAMQEKMQVFTKRCAEKGYPELSMRIGIHQGPAVVGNFGSDKRADYTAIGHTVNIAARIESACEPGSVYVSGAVAEGLLQETEYAGDFELKGVKSQKPLFKVLA